MSHRVVQWTTGNVGSQALREIIRHPDLELVGVFAHSKKKVDKDAGELCGTEESTGIVATNNIDSLLALKPDCVNYNPMWPDADELCRIRQPYGYCPCCAVPGL